MGGRRCLDPMKATPEAMPAYRAGVLPDPFVARTFVEAEKPPSDSHLWHQPMVLVEQ